MKKSIIAILSLFIAASMVYPNVNENLLTGARNGKIETVKAALKARADINVKDNEGNTALILASSFGHIEIVKFLIQAGADVNVRVPVGFTALMLASLKGHTEIVKLLKQAGARE